jgi:hypothetical protein
MLTLPPHHMSRQVGLLITNNYVNEAVTGVQMLVQSVTVY